MAINSPHAIEDRDDRHILDDHRHICCQHQIAFLQHALENPNNRRVSQTEKESIIEWLENSRKRPSSQQEFSRRNYVWKTFAWDEKTQSLLAVVKRDGEMLRAVVTEDLIADVVFSSLGKNLTSNFRGKIMRSSTEIKVDT